MESSHKHNSFKDNLAVIIIDMQDFFLEKFTNEKRKVLIENQSRVIAFCMTRKIPIIFVEYQGRGTTTAILQQAVKDVSDTEIVIKDSNGGFTNTNLDEILHNKNVKNIVLMGINASGCVQDTAIGALHRGYQVITSRGVVASSTKRDSDLNTSKKWYSENGLFFEDTDGLIDYIEKVTQSFSSEKMQEYSDLRNKDLSDKDFSSLLPQILNRCYYNTETKWPAHDHLPTGFNPQILLEESKNPGLGLRELHRHGITGKGVHVAIIDQKISQPSHEDYKVFSYSESIPPKKDDGVSMHGPAVASLLVGKSCGVAPEALLHYFAIPAGVPDFALCAQNLREMLRYNRTVALSEKIRVVSCSFPDVEYERFGQIEKWNKAGLQEWIKALEDAKNEGMVVVNGLNNDRGLVTVNSSESDSDRLTFIGGGSIDNKDDFESQDMWLKFKDTPTKEKTKIMAENIMVPTDYRTCAESWVKENQYFYGGLNGMSWSIPYLAGVIALGLQKNQNLMPRQIIQKIKKTVYIDKKGLRIVNPKAFIA
jgi:nicotinamidase-related amidase